MPQVAPYGEWVSPVDAADIVGVSHPVGGGQFVGDEVWWLEGRPGEAGRYAVRRAGADGWPEDVLPPPWNARSRVHEYGGGAWAVAGSALVFSEFGDQRLYRLDEPGGEPRPLTPAPPTPAAWRYAELQAIGDVEIWCVRERHGAGHTIERDLAAVPLDGSAADDPAAIRSVASGSRFLAGARRSPDGRHVAWIAWEHPQMPWDGTELRVAELRADGTCGPSRTLLGSTTESVLQPEWADDVTLWALSDTSGFWNVYRVPIDGAAAEPVGPVAADIGGPLWILGAGRYRALPDGRLLTVRTYGHDTLAVLDPGTGAYADLDLGNQTSVALGPVRNGRVLLGTGGARTVSGLRVLDLAAGTLSDVRTAMDHVPDSAYLPNAELMTLAGPQREVHAIVYAPQNPDFTAPEGERPPYLALVHGGPTAHAQPAVATSSVLYGYFTSRGIGVVEVNYGGSSGYGRAYRDRLRGQWGIVDVEDTVAAVQALADAGLADRARLAIQGGSAGGWTVLAALTGSDVFACGVSLFGVADLAALTRDTHDFESRYLDGLVGPLPEAAAVYAERAPVNKVDQLSCPVLLMQGLDDPIVAPAQAQRFREALVAKGLPHAYRPYEGESHGFRRRETLIDVYESTLSFFGQVLGFTPPGVPKLELWKP
jgi:dipeptidyl aminopeptidase/acylaminoacyl peptidase